MVNFIHYPGESMIDFLFEFIEVSQGLHSSYSQLNSRPTASMWTHFLKVIIIYLWVKAFPIFLLHIFPLKS